MIRFLKHIMFSIYLKFHSILMSLGVVMKNSEEDIFKANPNQLHERNKFNINVLHRLDFVQKMKDGVRDEKFVKEFYEVMRKADKFHLNATKLKKEIAIDEWGMSVGKDKFGQRLSEYGKDEWGRRYDHAGFFEDGHKNSGKTIAQVIEEELEDRRTKDDEFKIIQIINNEPQENSFSDEIIEGGDSIDTDFDEGFGAGGSVGGKMGIERGRAIKYPIRCESDREDRLNKIEQLTSYLHIKRFTEEISILEFFIPKKFKLQEFGEDSDIFNELIDIKYIWFTEKYGDLLGYNIDKYYKNIDIEIMVDDEKNKGEKIDVGYSVLKFYAKKMENVKIY